MRDDFHFGGGLGVFLGFVFQRTITDNPELDLGFEVFVDDDRDVVAVQPFDLLADADVAVLNGEAFRDQSLGDVVLRDAAVEQARVVRGAFDGQLVIFELIDELLLFLGEQFQFLLDLGPPGGEFFDLFGSRGVGEAVGSR